MRDPDRIDLFCKELAKIWKNNASDWRFGQLVCNVYGEASRDPFFYEEDETLKLFKKYFKIENKDDMLVIILGKSGSGKSSLHRELGNRGYNRIITTTTRPPRDGEKNAVDYTFMTNEEFATREEEGVFAEVQEFETTKGTWKYASAIKSFENTEGKEAIILSPSGLHSVTPILKASGKRFISVYLYADDAVLRNRLLNRGDDIEEINRRISADQVDFDNIEGCADLNIPIDRLSTEEIADIVCREVDMRNGR